MVIPTLWLFAFSREIPKSYFEIIMTSNDQPTAVKAVTFKEVLKGEKSYFDIILTSNDRSTAVDADAFEEFFKWEKRRFLGKDETNAELFKYFIKYQRVVVEHGNKVLVSSRGPFQSNYFSWYVFYP